MYLLGLGRWCYIEIGYTREAEKREYDTDRSELTSGQNLSNRFGDGRFLSHAKDSHELSRT